MHTRIKRDYALTREAVQTF